MSYLPVRLLLLVAALALCSISFTPKPRTPSPTTRAAAAPKGIMYFWFTYPDDEFNEYADLNTEATYWWYYYDGVIVNTVPTGGTLVSRGYSNNSYPHAGLPSAWLYAHFTY